MITNSFVVSAVMSLPTALIRAHLNLDDDRDPELLTHYANVAAMWVAAYTGQPFTTESACPRSRLEFHPLLGPHSGLNFKHTINAHQAHPEQFYRKVTTSQDTGIYGLKVARGTVPFPNMAPFTRSRFRNAAPVLGAAFCIRAGWPGGVAEFPAAFVVGVAGARGGL